MHLFGQYLAYGTQQSSGSEGCWPIISCDVQGSLSLGGGVCLVLTELLPFPACLGKAGGFLPLSSFGFYLFGPGEGKDSLSCSAQGGLHVLPSIPPVHLPKFLLLSHVVSKSLLFTRNMEIYAGQCQVLCNKFTKSFFYITSNL